MPKNHRVLPATALGLGAVLALVGCGGHGGTAGAADAARTSARATASAGVASTVPTTAAEARSLAQRAFDDLGSALSLHIHGSVNPSGENVSGGPAHLLDLTVTRNGDCTGAMSNGSNHFQILVVDEKTWQKTALADLEDPGTGTADAESKELADRWIDMTELGGAVLYGYWCKPSNLLISPGAVQTMTPHGTAVRDGQVVARLRDNTDSADVFVTMGAHPEVLEVDAGAYGKIDYSAFDAPVSITAPAKDSIYQGK